jgi:hypothetical protein
MKGLIGLLFFLTTGRFDGLESNTDFLLLMSREEEARSNQISIYRGEKAALPYEEGSRGSIAVH